jgi:ABC-type Na+ efflux pump permease subunit
MKLPAKAISQILWAPVLATPFTPATNAFAPGDRPPDDIAGLSFWIIAGIALYSYLALSVQIIARRTETPNDLFAWIPIANLFLLIAIAKKPIWWFFLLLIPLANVVIILLIWMDIAGAVGKPKWWGLLTLIPLVGLFVPGYLAFSE